MRGPWCSRFPRVSATGDNTSAGDTIEVLPPAGQFSPTDLDRDFLLWAGGSGITPVISILKSVLAAGSGRVTLCYANRDERSVIFAAELRELAGRYAGRLTVLHWLESVQGLPTRAQLGMFGGMFAGYDSYVCGPGPYMAAVKDALLESGFPRDSIHLEVFTSLTGDPFAEVVPVADAGGADAAEVAIDLDGTTHQLRWPRTATLVDVMLAAGLDVPYSCREGQCGSCAATVVSGEVEMTACGILDPDDLAAGLILGCQARPISDELQIEF